ncbi:MAG TPA: extracellular solute-binding protein [Planctomycetota bacterium]|jgi:ABC-type glycerol-3-phosphate transport system substrate-binding protein
MSSDEPEEETIPLYKWVIGIGSLVLFIAAAVAFQGESTSSEKTIRVTRNIGGRAGFQKHFDAWKDTFERKNPGWTMELVDLGNQNGAEYYKARIATNDLPDIVMTWQLTNLLSDAGCLIPLPDSYYEKFGITLPTPYKGKRYTSQGGMQIQGLVINRKMWADVGITEPPATWDELFAGFDKLKAKGYNPLVFGGREWSAMQPLLFAIAIDAYDRDTSKPSWTILRNQGKVKFATDPTMRVVIKKMIELIDKYVTKGSSSDGYNDEQRAFYHGKGATWMMGCWIGGDIEADRYDIDLDYWPIPSLTGKPPTFLETSSMPSGWAITTTAAGPKEALAMSAMETFWDPAVFQLFLNGEYQFHIGNKFGVTKPKSDFPPAQKLADRMLERLQKYGCTRGFHLALDDMPPPIMMDNTFKAVMQEILVGTRDVDKLLKMLDDDWDNGLKGM